MDYTLLLYLISRPNWFYLLPTYRYNWAQGYQEYCSEAPPWLPYLATVPLLSMIRPQPFSIYMVTTFFGCWSTNPRNPEWLYGSYSFKLTWIMTVSFDGSTGLPGTRTLKVTESRAGSTDSSGGLLGMIVIGVLQLSLLGSWTHVFYLLEMESIGAWAPSLDVSSQSWCLSNTFKRPFYCSSRLVVSRWHSMW